MQTLTFNTTKKEVILINSQGDIIYFQHNVPTVKVMDQHYEVYVEDFDGAHEVQESPMREGVPDKRQSKESEQGALAHTPRQRGHPDREHRQHAHCGQLGGPQQGHDQREHRPKHMLCPVGCLEEMEGELFAEMPSGVEVVA